MDIVDTGADTGLSIAVYISSSFLRDWWEFQHSIASHCVCASGQSGPRVGTAC